MTTLVKDTGVIAVELTLLEEMLGTASANNAMYRDWIASNRPDGVDEAEIETLPTVDEEVAKGMTVFHRDSEGRPFIYDYQIKGFFKDACGMLRRVSDSASSKLKAYKKVIDGLLFVSPRQIVLEVPVGEAVEDVKRETVLGSCTRPLRASGPQGDRVALACSEAVPPGTVLRFSVNLLQENLSGVLQEWLDYGVLRGLGQWRNSGKGRFTYNADF